jgi:hypothetical protein
MNENRVILAAGVYPDRNISEANWSCWGCGLDSSRPNGESRPCPGSGDTAGHQIPLPRELWHFR